MSAEPWVTQREYDRFVKTTDEAIAQLRVGQERLPDQLDEDIKTAVAAAVAAAFKARGEERSTSWVRRWAGIAAGAGLASAFVALMELWRSTGR